MASENKTSERNENSNTSETGGRGKKSKEKIFLRASFIEKFSRQVRERGRHIEMRAETGIIR